jgi:hypothetical protein
MPRREVAVTHHAAAEALVAANKDYDATVRDANDKLGVEVDA